MWQVSDESKCSICGYASQSYIDYLNHDCKQHKASLHTIASLAEALRTVRDWEEPRGDCISTRETLEAIRAHCRCSLLSAGLKELPDAER